MVCFAVSCSALFSSVLIRFVLLHSVLLRSVPFLSVVFYSNNVHMFTLSKGKDTNKLNNSGFSPDFKFFSKNCLSCSSTFSLQELCKDTKLNSERGQFEG